jgi:hypothetical protein
VTFFQMMGSPFFTGPTHPGIHLNWMKAKRGDAENAENFRGEFGDLQQSNEPPLPITAFPDSISALSSAISASPRFDESILMRQPCRFPARPTHQKTDLPQRPQRVAKKMGISGCQ